MTAAASIERGKRRRLAGRRPATAGFTLLEVLITSVLLAVLLGGIWGLYGMFADLYETGYLRTEKALLVRSLMQQLADDLNSTVQPPPQDSRRSRSGRRRSSSADEGSVFSTPSAGRRVASSADRVGFLGSFDSLRLDILQTAPPSAAASGAQDMGGPARATAGGRSVEIVTVIYTFQSPATTDELLVPEPGLKREEFHINQSAKLSSGATSSSLSDPYRGEQPGNDLDVASGEDSVSTRASAAARTIQRSSMRLPEVIALEFRYYDGTEWTDAWDSRARQALPLAVEIAMQIDFSESTNRQITEGEQLPSLAETIADDELFETAETDLFSETDERDPQQPPIHRFVVHLPQATQQSNDPSSLATSDELGLDVSEPEFPPDAVDLLIDDPASEELEPPRSPRVRR